MNCEVFIVNMDNKLVICFISTTLEGSINDTDSHSSLESCMLYQRIDSAAAGYYSFQILLNVLSQV
jgi:hypothetical protein